MTRELLMGNEAIAAGALAAGVQVVAGYPGTPSSEVLETIAKRNPGGVHVEWSVNEKAGAEVAAGAAYSGVRSMVTMKQMGLNVASDPIMCVNYIGVKGGMVIYVADDPGPISSQTEQDTRHFGKYARIPVFDCDSPGQAFQAVQDAFDFSETHGTPVILRSTTRVCHACEDIDVPEIKPPAPADGFEKDPKWVIFPGLSYRNKQKLVSREKDFAAEFSSYHGNTIEGSGPLGIACGGISYAYVKEALSVLESESSRFSEQFTVLKIATPYPFPSQLADSFLDSVQQVIVFEELDPYIEDALIYEQGRRGKSGQVPIAGKRTETVPAAGELTVIKVAGILRGFATDASGEDSAVSGDAPADSTSASANSCDAPSDSCDAPDLPVRPPVLCAGCPHRGSFYAVKTAVGRALKKLPYTQAVYHGDIGCYTLGNAAPLNMVDTCLCMGAGITMAQGMNHADKNTLNFAFAGHQPHPGMGITMMGKKVEPIDIAKVLEGIGVPWIRTVDPLDLEASVRTVTEAIDGSGVRAIIFKSPCIALFKPKQTCSVDADACIGCMRCIREIGCPALTPDSSAEKKTVIDPALCTGCGLCAQVCPVSCIGTRPAGTGKEASK